MTNNQFQKIALDRCYFWHGVLTLNDVVVSSFFDIRIQRTVQDSPDLIGLYTNDVPPIPFTISDSIRVNLSIENKILQEPFKYKVVEACTTGMELVSLVEADEQMPPSLTIENDGGRWHFTLQDKVYILRSLLVYVPSEQIKKYVKDL